ncbi:MULTISPECIES: hypothetical protein [unclassified Streptomyces]|uniref:hypothetical protein n=1 Tax=unclassified Streptomyces TaxID=2593676 RepID=UPI0029668197|nr:hypothetical protein [Streptomyces sp. SJL17-1]
MPAAAQTDADGRVPVYAVYAATRVDALYDTATQSVTIPEGNPGAGAYKSPSGASRAVIEALRPDVLPIRTGWAFWRIASSGQILRTIRPPSATALAARALPPTAPQAAPAARSR